MHPHWLSDIALFIEVAHSKSFSKAAEHLEIPASTLSRRIAAMEARIGFRLLNRTTRKVDVTEEGAAYFLRCKHLVDEAALAHEEISTTVHVVSGVLRLACTADFANLYMAPILAAFTQAYPAVSVELSLNSQVEDLLANHLDLAIRMGPQRNSSLVTRHLIAFQQGLYASPEFLKANGHRLQTPQDLSTVECVRLKSNALGSLWSLRKPSTSGETRQQIAVQGRLIAGGPHLACQLTMLGAGVGLLPQNLANVYVQSGQLLRVLPAWQPADVQVQALTTSRLLPARVRRFIEHLTQSLTGSSTTPGSPTSSTSSDFDA